MSKPIKYAVAVVLTERQAADRFLVVKRPADDPDLRGNWGLPAVTTRPGELLENAARRVCSEKLHCSATPLRFVGAMFQKRNNYDILLVDIEMVLEEGSRPDCRRANTPHTAYVDQKWTDDPLTLMSSAKGGSCCSSILLTDKGLLDKEEWVSSLEGSSMVG